MVTSVTAQSMAGAEARRSRADRLWSDNQSQQGVIDVVTETAGRDRNGQSLVLVCTRCEIAWRDPAIAGSACPECGDLAVRSLSGIELFKAVTARNYFGRRPR
jgi:hypothetical protein